MPVFDARRIASDCGGTWRGLPTTAITGFAIDTRRLRGGEIFVALRTEKRDGHDFIGVAAEQGASGALVSAPRDNARIAQLHVVDSLAALQAIARAHRGRFTAPVIGVTGSAGKTSTKDLLATILGEPGEILATEENLNNHLGVPLTLLRIDPARHRAAVIEAGISERGEMDLLGSLIAPDIAIVTAVAPAHLDGLGSVESIAVEKARLAAHLRPDGIAVFPAECLRFEAFRKAGARALVAVPAGAEVPDVPPGAQIVPFAICHEGSITNVCVTWTGTVVEVGLRRVTRGMAGNVVLAVIAALHLGRDADDIRRRLERWKPAPLRGEVRTHHGRVFYLDCYNANPASMADAVEGFVALTPGDAPRLYVVGCMEELGGEAPALHREVGERWPLRPQDRAIVFGALAAELAAGLRAVAPGAEVLVNPERGVAEALIRDFAGAVFVKGSRAHRLETLVHAAGVATHHGEENAA